MSRLSRCAAVAVFTAAIAAPGAYARTHHKAAGPYAGAHNGLSDTEIRQQCFAEAKQRYPSTSQDMQTNRVFTYTTCASDRGIRP
jgi:hypothetical protein